jgi:tetratricopeptide (TPR) repeat protein
MDITWTVAPALMVAAVLTGPPDSARARYRAGVAAASSGDKVAQHEAGVKLARATLAARPDDPDGLLWLAANLGAGGLARGKLTALRVLPEMEQTLLRLDAVAPAYEHAAAARTLARLYQKAPAIISIGSSDKARRYFERALALGPGFPGNQALAADFFAGEGDRARAVALARQALAAPGLDAYPDGPEWRAIARHVLEEGGR